jgi:predicted N-formylglutamate amidohydrolase
MSKDDAEAASKYLLSEQDPPAFECVNRYGAGNTLLVCDHASHQIPSRLGDLGLKPEYLRQHIAWDPGAGAVARLLAELLDAPLLLSRYSRLVIDCNRPLASPDSIAEQSAGISVPGNRALSLAARQQRIDEVFKPYHQAIAALLDARQGSLNRLLSIHSFTATLNGQRRPWSIGVSSRRRREYAERLLRLLRDSKAGAVGDNQPYPIEDAYDYTLPTHGERRGIACAMIEIRQDALCDDAAVQLWAERLAAASRYAQ